MPVFKKHKSQNHYDVFNGDADGICALHQFRLAYPAANAELVTGVKRDITLLARIKDVTGSQITVMDVSMHSNREYLTQLLEADNDILYIDHHFAGDIPHSAQLKHYIDPSPDTCTSLIVDGMLDGKFRQWAICGAFGDNLHASAQAIAAEMSLPPEDTKKLREIGELINYNGYGAQLQDLYFLPDQLFRVIEHYRNPLDFYDQSKTLKTLKQGYRSDMDQALSQSEFKRMGKNKVYRFPDSPWARRVSGVFANLKARENPEGAHALITENNDKTLRISVRAPLADRKNADTLCRSFPSGGGRAAAAGINTLPAHLLDSFFEAFANIYN